MPPDVTSAQSGHVLGLIRNLTTVLDLEGSGVRLGLAPKPCHVVPGFSLGEGSTNKEEVISKMTSFPVKRADPGEVIKHIRDVSFQESHGARHTSRKIGVAFVDTAGGRGDLILAASEMPRMQNDGIELLVVGVGDKVSRTELNSLIAPDMDRNVMISSSWEHLNDLSDQMKRRFDDLCAGKYYSLFPIQFLYLKTFKNNSSRFLLLVLLLQSTSNTSSRGIIGSSSSSSSTK